MKTSHTHLYRHMPMQNGLMVIWNLNNTDNFGDAGGKCIWNDLIINCLLETSVFTNYNFWPLLSVATIKYHIRITHFPNQAYIYILFCYIPFTLRGKPARNYKAEMSYTLRIFHHTICIPKNMQPGPSLNIKTVLSRYGDFHVKDKTAVRTSYL